MNCAKYLKYSVLDACWKNYNLKILFNLCFSGSFSAEENIRFRYNQTVCANNTITLNIYFDYIQCNHFNGHIFVKIVANCTETWCKNSELTVSMNQTSSNQLLFLLPNLFPFSKYDLTVQRSRNAYSDWELVKSEKFKTTSSGKWIFHKTTNFYL